MPEREDFPPPREFVRSLAAAAGLSAEAEPTWGYGEPVRRLFAEEGPTFEQRKMAQGFLSQFAAYTQGPEGVIRPVQPEDAEQAFLSFREEARERWAVAFEGVPFPGLTLTHVLGATKRTIAWFEELKHFEETANYDYALRLYGAVYNLVEQAMPPSGGQDPA